MLSAKPTAGPFEVFENPTIVNPGECLMPLLIHQFQVHEQLAGKRRQLLKENGFHMPTGVQHCGKFTLPTAFQKSPQKVGLGEGLPS